MGTLRNFSIQPRNDGKREDLLFQEFKELIIKGNKSWQFSYFWEKKTLERSQKTTTGYEKKRERLIGLPNWQHQCLRVKRAVIPTRKIKARRHGKRLCGVLR